MRTKIVIVYGEKSKILRRVMVPDDDSQLPVLAAAICDGEAALAVDWKQGTLQDAEAVLEAAVGPPTPNPGAMIDKDGKVQGIIADADVDHACVLSDCGAVPCESEVREGWDFDGVKFAKPPVPPKDDPDAASQLAKP
jgi:hypothetical protein